MVDKIEITPCSIKVIISGEKDDGSHQWMKFEIPLFEDLTVETRSSKIYIYPSKGTDLISLEDKYDFHDEFDNRFYSDSFRLRNGEQNFAERMQKALRHLASFCEKKKETF